MTLITGSVYGQQNTTEEIYFDGAPNIWFQDSHAGEYFNPDARGFYWQLSGTVAYPAYELGCVNDVSLTENLTMNDVVCDTVGFKSTIQRRNSMDIVLSIQTLFPLETLVHMIKGGGYVRTTGQMEQFGLGQIDPSKFYHVYCARVYNESLGYYISFTAHRAQFVDAFTLNFRYGNNWQLTGVKLRAFADATKPAAQSFMTVVRADTTV